MSAGAAGTPDLAETVARFVKFAAAGLSQGRMADESAKPGVESMPVDRSAAGPVIDNDAIQIETAAVAASEPTSEPEPEAEGVGSVQMPKRRARKPAAESPQAFFNF